LRTRPWFLGRRRYITGLSLQNVLALPETSAHLLFLNVEYGDGDPEVYLVPISVATGDRSEAILHDRPDVVLARLDGPGPETTALLYGATFDRDFSDSLLRSIVRRRRIRGESGELLGAHTREFRKAWTSAHSNLEPSPQQTDQSFTVINYGDHLVLKLYRKLEEGINPGREVPEFLCAQTNFTAVPRALGSLDYRRQRLDVTLETTIGTLSGFIRNATNGWNYTLDHLGLFFEHALAIPQEHIVGAHLALPDPLTAGAGPVPQIVAELLGTHVDSIRVLAQRTAELHAALSSRTDLPNFAPEPFTTFYRQGVYHGMLGQLNRAFELLRGRARGLPQNAQQDIAEVLNREDEIRQQLLLLRDKRMSGNRIRNHGDFHLANVLFSGSDWVVTNFEGDPTRPLSERRIKRSALRDVATMLRSFHYVSHAALFGDVPGIVPSRDGHPQLERWALTWYRWVSAIFLREYLQAAAGGPFLPQQDDELRILLGAYMTERALSEIEYELEHRPEWIRIPVHGILEQLKAE
jgi:maltose alpha-D-glucosyltransferase/alpha-amylase